MHDSCPSWLSKCGSQSSCSRPLLYFFPNLFITERSHLQQIACHFSFCSTEKHNTKWLCSGNPFLLSRCPRTLFLVHMRLSLLRCVVHVGTNQSRLVWQEVVLFCLHVINGKWKRHVSPPEVIYRRWIIMHHINTWKFFLKDLSSSWCINVS